MNDRIDGYISVINERWAYYGHTNRQPLTRSEVGYCIGVGVTLDQLYSIACDVNAGFTVQESIMAGVES